MADSVILGCGVSAGDTSYPEQTGDFSIAAITLGIGGPLEWVTDTDFDNNLAIEFTGSVAEHALQINTPVSGDLEVGPWADPITFACRVKVDNLTERQPLYFVSDGALDYYGYWAVYIDTDGTVVAEEYGDGTVRIRSTSTVSAGSVVDIAICRYNTTGTDVGYAVSIDGTVEAMAADAGSPSNFAFADASEHAYIGLAYLYDTVEEDFDTVWLDGRMAKLEVQAVEAFTAVDGTYNHVFFECPATEGLSGFWTDFVRTAETNQVVLAIVYRDDPRGGYFDGYNAGVAFAVSNFPPDGGPFTAEYDSIADDILDAVTAYNMGYFAALDVTKTAYDGSGVISLADAVKVRTSGLRSAAEILGAHWGQTMGYAQVQAGVGWASDFKFRVNNGGSEFDRWFRVSYLGAWDGTIAAFIDDDNADPQDTSKLTDSPPFSTLQADERATYTRMRSAAYDAVWALLNP